jgi:hypothetical protein
MVNLWLIYGPSKSLKITIPFWFMKFPWLVSYPDPRLREKKNIKGGFLK